MTSDFPADALTPVTRTELRPAYVQIASQIRRTVAERLVKPGAKLPAESELVERFGVSRMTVREGPRVLRLEGVLCAEHGIDVSTEGEGGRQAPAQVGGVMAPSEAAWREAVAEALSSPTPVGQWSRQSPSIQARLFGSAVVCMLDSPPLGLALQSSGLHGSETPHSTDSICDRKWVQKLVSAQGLRAVV